MGIFKIKLSKSGLDLTIYHENYVFLVDNNGGSHPITSSKTLEKDIVVERPHSLVTFTLTWSTLPRLFMDLISEMLVWLEMGRMAVGGGGNE